MEVLAEVHLADSEDPVEWGADRLALDRGLDLADPGIRLLQLGRLLIEVGLRRYPLLAKRASARIKPSKM
jgi:hypothetical protein